MLEYLRSSYLVLPSFLDLIKPKGLYLVLPGFLEQTSNRTFGKPFDDWLVSIRVFFWGFVAINSHESTATGAKFRFFYSFFVLFCLVCVCVCVCVGGAGGGAWGWKPGGGVPLTLFSLVDVFIGARRDQRCGLDVDEVDFLIFGDCGNFFGVFFCFFFCFFMTD